MEYWYFLTGPKHMQDLHATHMQSVNFFIPAIAPNGQSIQHQIKSGFEPVQLIRFVFPREAMPLVVNTLGTENKKGFALNAAGLALRKSLGLKDINDYWKPEMKNDAKMPVSLDYCHIIPLGIKDDGEDRIMQTGVKQEPL